MALNHIFKLLQISTISAIYLPITFSIYLNNLHIYIIHIWFYTISSAVFRYLSMYDF